MRCVVPDKLLLQLVTEWLRPIDEAPPHSSLPPNHPGPLPALLDTPALLNGALAADGTTLLNGSKTDTNGSAHICKAFLVCNGMEIALRLEPQAGNRSAALGSNGGEPKAVTAHQQQQQQQHLQASANGPEAAGSGQTALPGLGQNGRSFHCCCGRPETCRGRALERFVRLEQTQHKSSQAWAEPTEAACSEVPRATGAQALAANGSRGTSSKPQGSLVLGSQDGAGDVLEPSLGQLHSKQQEAAPSPFGDADREHESCQQPEREQQQQDQGLLGGLQAELSWDASRPPIKEIIHIHRTICVALEDFAREAGLLQQRSDVTMQQLALLVERHRSAMGDMRWGGAAALQAGGRGAQAGKLRGVALPVVCGNERQGGEL